MTETTCRTLSRVQQQTEKRSNLSKKTALVPFVIIVGLKKSVFSKLSVNFRNTHEKLARFSPQKKKNTEFSNPLTIGSWKQFDPPLLKSTKINR